MAITNQSNHLNLIPNISAPITVHVSYSDSGVELHFILLNGYETFTEEGVAVSAYGIRRDGVHWGPIACNYMLGNVSFTLPDAATYCDGGGMAEIRVVDGGGETVGSANFGVLVENAPMPDTVIYDSDPSVFESILAFIQSFPAKLVDDYTTRINLEIGERKEAIETEAAIRAAADTINSNAIAVEKARIDAFTHLSEGSTTGDAELMDIRAGGDGIEYPTAGDAVRGQYIELKSDIDAVNSKPKLYWNLGKHIADDGHISNNSTTAITDIVTAQTGDKIVYTGEIKDSNNVNLIIYIALYSTAVAPNDTFVERQTLYNNTITIQSGVTGYRFLFGRQVDTGITITEEDIALYFDADIYQKSVSGVTFEKLEQTVSGMQSERFGAVGAMVDIAETYFNQAYSAFNQIVYDSLHGIYTDPVNLAGKKATVCSQFMKSLLMGTPYKYSRYVQNENSPSWWAYEYDSSTDAEFTTGGRGLLSSDQAAKYCDDKGILVPFDVDHNNLRPGDVVFWSDENATGKYLNVVHCAICLYQYQYLTEKGCYIIQAGSNKPRPVDGEDVGIDCYKVNFATYTPSYYARLPLIAGNYQCKCLYKDYEIYTGTYTGSSTHIHGFEFNELPLGFYSVLWEDNSSDGVTYIKFNRNGVDENIIPFKQGNKCYLVFYATEPIENLDIRAGGGSSYSVKNFTLYKGYRTVNDDEIPDRLPDDTTFEVDSYEEASARLAGDTRLQNEINKIAPAFKTTVAYTAGDYVYYNNILYRFSVNHDAGSWIGTDAQAVILTDEINDAVSTLQSNISTETAARENVEKGIASIFSETASYNDGDYVYYNNILYRFTTNHSAGAWSGADVVEAVLANDVVSLSDNVDTISGNVNTISGNIDTINTRNYYYYSGSNTTLLAYVSGLPVGTYIVSTNKFTDSPASGYWIYQIVSMASTNPQSMIIAYKMNATVEMYIAYLSTSATSVAWKQVTVT